VDNETRVYFIPVAVGTKTVPNLDSTVPQYWLHQQTDGLSIELSNAEDWVILNSGATGTSSRLGPSLSLRRPTSLSNLHDYCECSHRGSDYFLLSLGYYRVQYDDRLREKLESQLSTDHSLILSASRTQLIDDYFTMAFDGTITFIPIMPFTIQMLRFYSALFVKVKLGWKVP